MSFLPAAARPVLAAAALTVAAACSGPVADEMPLRGPGEPATAAPAAIGPGTDPAVEEAAESTGEPDWEPAFSDSLAPDGPIPSGTDPARDGADRPSGKPAAPGPGDGPGDEPGDGPDVGESTGPVQLTAVPPQPVPDPASLIGLHPDQLTVVLGPPGLVRRDAPAEVWQYVGDDCVLDLYLYRADTHRVDGGAGARGEEKAGMGDTEAGARAYRVTYFEMRARGGGRVSERGCLTGLVAARHRGERG